MALAVLPVSAIVDKARDHTTGTLAGERPLTRLRPGFSLSLDDGWGCVWTEERVGAFMGLMGNLSPQAREKPNYRV